MKKADKYLLGIALGIGILVIVTVIMVLSRPGPEYRSDDSPEAIVHNYLLALNEGDYARAYGHVSSQIRGYPRDLEIFVDTVEDNSWSFGRGGDSALEIQSSRLTGDKSTVKVLETIYHSGGIFDSGQYVREFDMKLVQENGAWKLVDGDLYWYYCWSNDRPTYCK